MANPVKVLIKNNETVLIGRDQKCDMVIRHMSVSNRHCEIGVGGDTEGLPHCYVKDLSSNGTWVRRMIGENKVLSKPDRIKKGTTHDLFTGDLILLLPPGHTDNHVFQLGLEYDHTSKQYAVQFNAQNQSTCAERSSEIEGAERKIHEEPMGVKQRDGQNGDSCDRLQYANGLPGRENDHLAIVTAKESCISRLSSDFSEVYGLPHDPKEESHGPKEDSHNLSLKENSANTNSTVLTTPSTHTTSVSPLLLKETDESFKVKMYCNSSRVATSPPRDPKVATSPPRDPRVSSVREGDKDSCPLCNCVFPVSMLTAHCEVCSGRVADKASATPPLTPSPSVPPVLKPAVSLEQCPTCGLLFVVPELIPHWEMCHKKEVSFKSDDGSDCLEQCLHCLKEYLLSDLMEHVENCPMKDKKCLEEEQCHHCFKNFPLNDLVEHISVCSSVNAKGSDGETLERCMHCFRDFPLSSLIHHTAVCSEDLSGSKERFRGFVPSVHDLDATAIAVLNETQRRAVDYVIERSRTESDKVYPSLVERVCRLGYLEKDVQRTLQWIRNEAPIIIHVSLERALGFLVKDTHYRNQFETRTSGGSTDLRARSSWEDNIFNNIYASSPPFDRVKYGVLNIVGDPHGVRSCYHYGDSFLQLKKVRLRTTFASMDTSCGAVKLSCCEYYGNVLNEYTDMELKAILDVATRRVPSMKSDMISNYKEVQIHGPVCLSENVECIVVNHRYRGETSMETLLEEFVKKNGCNLIWMDPDDSPGTLSMVPHRPVYPHYTYTRRHRKRRRRDYYYDPSYS